jgi:hypothetical protein
LAGADEKLKKKKTQQSNTQLKTMGREKGGRKEDKNIEYYKTSWLQPLHL